jgi:hypothetical protein
MTYVKNPKDKILEYMRQVGTTQSPREVADSAGVDYQYTRQLMPKMADEGTLTKVGWGEYRAPFDSTQLDEDKLLPPDNLQSGRVSSASLIDVEAPAQHLFKDKFTVSVYYDPVVTKKGLRYDPGRVYRIDMPPALLVDWFGELRKSLGAFLTPSDWMSPAFDNGQLIWYAPSPEISVPGYYAVSLDGVLEPRRVELLHGGDFRLIPGNPSGQYSPVTLNATDQPGRFMTDQGRNVQFWCAGKIIRPTPNQ